MVGLDPHQRDLLAAWRRRRLARVTRSGFSDRAPREAIAISPDAGQVIPAYYSLVNGYTSLGLAQARSFQNFGDRPLVVVTAARDSQAGWLPLPDRMATLSTNSSHRVVPYTHNAPVTDRTAAQTSIQAIRDVVHAVRSNAPLDKLQ